MLRGKKAALELSIGTIVILVLAMSMLILGVILVQKIFEGSTENVKEINDKVKEKIRGLFSDDDKAVLLVTNGIAEIKQGEQFGIGWGLKNQIESQTFTWEVRVTDSRVEEKCGVKDEKVMSWISAGDTGSAPISSGDSYEDLIRFNIPKGATSDVSKCIVRYQLVILKEDGKGYDTLPFDLDVK